MNVKYKIINYNIIEEKKCISMLELEAARGWMLDKVGATFFRFKKAQPQRVKFLIDYTPASQDYIAVISEFGYTFVGNYYSFSFWYNTDYQAESLQTDPEAKAMAINSVYKPSVIVLIFFLAFLLMVFSDPTGHLFDWVRFDTGGAILYQSLLIPFVLINLMALWGILQALTQLFIRIKFSRESQGLSTPMVIYHALKLGSYLLLALIGFSAILLLIFADSADLAFVLSSVLGLVALMTIRSIDNKISTIENLNQRKVARAVLLITWIVITQLTIQFGSGNSNNAVALEPAGIQTATYNDGYYEEYLFFEETLYIGSVVQGDFSESYEGSYVERIYDCQNDFVANAIFEYQVENTEHDSKIPSQDEILTSGASFNSDRDVEYKSFEDAVLVMDKITSEKIESGYRSGPRCIMKNDTRVVYVLLNNDAELAKIIDSYF